MNVTEVLRNKIETLEEYVDQINQENEENYDPEDWSGGNFDDCYELGCSHGRKFGRLGAYREILAFLEN